MNIVNSTLSGNSATGGGSAIYSLAEGQLTISGSTIAFNRGPNALRMAGSAAVTIVNTIIASNYGEQCSTVGAASLTSNGHNLASDATCNLTATGDIPDGDARLDDLADNGGSTLTHALIPGSNAIDAGDPALCPDQDQRGQFRNGVCDIGAFEFFAVPVWGDLDCDSEISSRDNQALLRNVLTQAALSQTEPCPDIGSAPGITVPAGSEPLAWGDLDCDGEISSRDNQALLRNVLTQAALSQTEPCPDIGAEVLLIEGA